VQQIACRVLFVPHLAVLRWHVAPELVLRGHGCFPPAGNFALQLRVQRELAWPVACAALAYFLTRAANEVL